MFFTPLKLPSDRPRSIPFSSYTCRSLCNKNFRFNVSCTPAFLPRSIISTAAHNSQYFGANSTPRSKILVHRTAKESPSLHCRDTFASYLLTLCIAINVPVFSAHSFSRSFLTFVIQKLPAPHSRVTPLFSKLALLCKQTSPISFSRYTCFCPR